MISIFKYMTQSNTVQLRVFLGILFSIYFFKYVNEYIIKVLIEVGPKLKKKILSKQRNHKNKILRPIKVVQKKILRKIYNSFPIIFRISGIFDFLLKLITYPIGYLLFITHLRTQRIQCNCMPNSNKMKSKLNISNMFMNRTKKCVFVK